ncbi:MAG: hypothetical protein JWQ08_582, partial [Deinococcus sp.]|nr:hypothetical protein [Deinococcus sp.]
LHRKRVFGKAAHQLIDPHADPTVPLRIGDFGVQDDAQRLPRIVRGSKGHDGIYQQCP